MTDFLGNVVKEGDKIIFGKNRKANNYGRPQRSSLMMGAISKIGQFGSAEVAYVDQYRLESQYICKIKEE